jgi:plastocyanin
MRVFVVSAIVALGFTAWGCGGSSYPGGTPVSPSPAPTPAPTGNVVTINIISENGAQSFSPNPATLPAGQMVVWHNVDRVTHHVVLNNGSLDTGDLVPGASSQAMSLNLSTAPYHCSIHPSMVGTLVQSALTSPSPSN